MAEPISASGRVFRYRVLPESTAPEWVAMEERAHTMYQLGHHCIACAEAALGTAKAGVKGAYKVPSSDEELLAVIYTEDWNLNYPVDLKDAILDAALEKAHHMPTFRQLIYRGVPGRSGLGGFVFNRQLFRSGPSQVSNYGGDSSPGPDLEWKSYRLNAAGEVIESHISKGAIKRPLRSAQDYRSEAIVPVTLSMASSMLRTFAQG